MSSPRTNTAESRPAQQQDLTGIVGHACRVAGASNPSQLWDLLVQQKDVRRSIPNDRFRAEAFYHPHGPHKGTNNVSSAYFLDQHPGMFDAAFFQVSRKEAESMDPQQRILLEVVYEALEDAGITLESIAGTNTSVFTGSFSNDYQRLLDLDLATQPRYAVTGMGNSMTSSRISYFFDLHGECISLDTACSSSLTALHLANDCLKSGRSDMAIVACSALHFHPGLFAELQDLGMLSPDGASKAYDASANGYARGEGVAAIILKRVGDAEKQNDSIHAVVRATAINHDGATQGITLPNAQAQESLIRQTYWEACLDTKDTRYFEGHGTGTVVGDQKEVEAIASVFSNDGRSEPVLLGSVKTNVGHCEGAAGLVSIIKTIQAIRRSKIPPNMHFKQANKYVEASRQTLRVPTSVIDWPLNDHFRRASINSFGYGGSNAHVILEAHQTSSHFPDRVPSPADSTYESGSDSHDQAKFVIVPISSHNEASGRNVVERLHQYACKHADLDLSQLAHTLSARRSLHSYRTFIIAHDSETLINGLSKKHEWFVAPPKEQRVGFVFTGQGAAWATMSSGLLGANATFTEAIRRCDAILHALPDAPSWNIEEELLRPKATSNLRRSEYSQPICISVQLALIEVLRSWGVQPTAVCGHSSGEIPAAHAAGILSFETAVVYAYYRGLYTSKQRPEASQHPGAMLSVGMSEAETVKMLDEYQGRLTLAAINSPTSCTISGDEDAISAVEQHLDTRNIFALQLDVNQAYHSHHMLGFAQVYEQAMHDCASAHATRPPTARMFSAVTARPVDWKMMGPKYWIENLVSTVRFSDALMGTVLDEFDENQVEVLVEIGPETVLRGPSRQTLSAQRKELPYVGTLSKNSDDHQSLLNTAGTLFKLGVPVKLDAVNGITTKHTLPDLPSYPWDHQKYWAASRLANEMLLEQTRHPLLGTKLPGWTTTACRWRNVLRLDELPFLADDKEHEAPMLTPAMLVSMVVEACVCFAGDSPFESVALQNLEIRQLLPLNRDESGTEVITELVRLSRLGDAPAMLMLSIHAYGEDLQCTEVLRCTAAMAQHDALNLSNGHSQDAISTWKSSGVIFRDTSHDPQKCSIHPDLLGKCWDALSNHLMTLQRIRHACTVSPKSLGCIMLSLPSIRALGSLAAKGVNADVKMRPRDHSPRTQAGDVEITLDNPTAVLMSCENVEYDIYPDAESDAGLTPVKSSTKANAEGMSVGSQLKAACDEQSQTDILTAAFLQRLSTLTGIPSDEIQVATQLSTYGLDSLMASDVRSWFQKVVGVTFTLGNLLKADSIRALIDDAVRKIAPPVGQAAVPHPALARANSDLRMPTIPPAPTDQNTPLSSFQTRLWFTQTLVGDTKLFNCRLLLMLRGAVDHTAMRAAWTKFAEVNSVFRTAFFEGDDFTVQKVVSRPDVDMPLHDLSHNPAPHLALEGLSRSIQGEDFKLEDGDCFRVVLVKLTDSEHCLVFIVHHLVFDRGSSHRLLEQLTSFYDDALQRRPSDLSRWKRTQYIDFTLWHNAQMKSQLVASYLEHWQTVLAGCPPRASLLPFAKPNAGASQGIRTASHRATLDARLLGRMKRLCGSLGLTPFHFLLASLMAFYHRYTGTTDLVILAVDGDRPHPDVSDMIGLFTNMLPIRLIHDYQGSMNDVMKTTKTAALDAANHPAPFDEIVRATHTKTAPGVFPLGQIALNYQVHGTMPKFSTSDFVVEQYITEDVPTACDMSLEAIDDPVGGLKLALEHSLALYDASDMSRFLGNFVCFLENVIKDHWQPVNQVPMAGNEELALLAKHWNSPRHDNISASLQIADTILQHASKAPDKEACCTDDGESITYSALVRAAQGVAGALAKEGMQPGSHIGLYTSPGLQQIIGILGILFRRSAYVPLDPKFAEERLAFMADDSGSAIVLVADGDVKNACKIFKHQRLLSISEAAKHKPEAKAQLSELHDPLYVTYTSGSTGKPKGTVMRHSNATPMFAAIEKQYGFNSSDKFLHQITMAFDLSAVQIFSPLLAGGTICIASAEARKEASMLARFMHSSEVTFTYFTPTQFGLLLESDPDTLRACQKWRIAWFCGEAFPNRLAAAFYELQVGAELYNTYGPCEAMVQATIYHVPGPKSDTKVVPIGFALPTIQHYLLDEAQNPLPTGVTGELYLGGPQVGTGYLNRAAETAKAFIDDPFASDLFTNASLLGGKMFKTGDLCRLDTANNLHFVGRKAGDKMIKLRGNRIDVGEIEQQILQRANKEEAGNLRDVCVVARHPSSEPHDAGDQLMDERQLFAFLVLRRGHTASKHDFVRHVAQSLRQSLNEYMVPSGYMFLDEMPTTMSGKTDRRSLLTRELTGLIRAGSGGSTAAESTAKPVIARLKSSMRAQSRGLSRPMVVRAVTRKQLDRPTVKRAVSKLLRVTLQLPDGAPVDVDTSFFDLGGSSLSLMRLHNRLKRDLGTKVTLKELFANPTKDGIIATIVPEEDAQAPVAPDPDAMQATILSQSPASQLRGPQLEKKGGIDWAKEIKLPDDSRYRVPVVEEDSYFTAADPTDIFLTGADLFHGMHLLAYMLQSTGDIIHLVGTEQRLTKEHLIARFRHYKLFHDNVDEEVLLKRTRIHKGTMAQDHFGFSPTDYVLLGSRVHSIYNTGVSVSLLKSYTALRDIDVGRMRDLVELAACGGKASTITHLSTFSVPQLQSWHGVKRTERHRVITTEESARSYTPPTDNENGYGPVRWVGERVLDAAAERGFPINILRGSAMTGALSTGVPEPRCGVVQQSIMGIVMTGVVPDMPGFVADFVPIDVLATWIYALGSQTTNETANAARYYHVVNPSPLPIQDLQKFVPNADIGPNTDLRTVSMDEWFRIMERDAAPGDGDDIRWAGLSAFFGTGHVYWGLDTAATKCKLAGLGIDMGKCPPVDKAYIRKLHANWMATDACTDACG